MAEWVSLCEAIAGNVHDGDCLALEGFTHLIVKQSERSFVEKLGFITSVGFLSGGDSRICFLERSR